MQRMHPISRLIRVGTLLLATLLAVTLVNTAPAHAAPGGAKSGVNISKRAATMTTSSTKVTLKPASVSTRGNARIHSKTVTVTKAGKTIAKNKRSVKVGAGKYLVTTNVRYLAGNRVFVSKRANWVTVKWTGKKVTKSVKYGKWTPIVKCESGGNWRINTGNGYYGGLQFSLRTWREFGGRGYPHHASAAEQIRVAEKVLRVQGWGAWPHCSRKAGYR